MTDQPTPPITETPLESWKAIAAYLNRDARTVMRWEQAEGLPVHRHQHFARSTVYAYPSELDRWRANRKPEGKVVERPPLATWQRSLAMVPMMLLTLATVGGGSVVGTAPVGGQTALRTEAAQLQKLVCEQCGHPDASISADGRFLATVIPVANPNHPVSDVAVLDLHTDTIAPLGIVEPNAVAPGSAGWPVFSPDGTELAYSFLKGTSGTELRVMSRAPRGKSRVLVSFPPFHVVQPIAWSASGSLVIRLHMPDSTNRLALVSVAEGTVTSLKSLDRRVPNALAGKMSLSADGRYLAYAALAMNPTSGRSGARSEEANDWQIYALALDGTSDVALTSGVGAKAGAIWSADGRFILYSSNVTGAWDLWAVPVRAGRPAGAPTLVRKDIGRIVPIGMSSAGVQYFYEERPGVYRTSIAHVGDTGRSRGEVVKSVIGEYPAWSPDGRLLVVSRPRPDGISGRDIVVVDVETAKERLYRHPLVGGAAQWFPDGKALLVLAGDPTESDSSRRSWYRLDLQSGEFRRQAPYRVDRSAWGLASTRTLSPDGTTLYLGGYVYPDDEPDRIFALDLLSGTHREVYRLSHDDAGVPRAGGRQFALAVSPDGRRLAVAFIDFRSGHVRLSSVGADGRGYRELAELARPATLSNQLVWSQDGQWIYVSTRPANTPGDRIRVVRIPASGGPAEAAGIEVDGLSAFTVHPDKTRLAFSTTRPEGAGHLVWALDVAAILGRR